MLAKKKFFFNRNKCVLFVGSVDLPKITMLHIFFNLLLTN